ncbi:hypothetical protein ES703_86909 [subsurface metagenome]
MSLTWVDIVAMSVVIVVGSLIAGFVSAWWEERKRDKNKRPPPKT